MVHVWYFVIGLWYFCRRSIEWVLTCGIWYIHMIESFGYDHVNLWSILTQLSFPGDSGTPAMPWDSLLDSVTHGFGPVRERLTLHTYHRDWWHNWKLVLEQNGFPAAVTKNHNGFLFWRDDHTLYTVGYVHVYAFVLWFLSASRLVTLSFWFFLIFMLHLGLLMISVFSEHNLRREEKAKMRAPLSR